MQTMRWVQLLIMTIVFSSCDVTDSDTQFTVTLTPVSGEDKSLTTQEDTSLLISYSLELDEDSSSPWLKISKSPSYGDLSSCTQENDYSIECIYTPNENFNGEDSITLKSGDGSFESSKSIEIAITVTSVNDAPVADSDTLYMESNSELDFVLLGSDVDSITQDLVYSYSLGSNATGSLTCDEDSNYRSCTYISSKGENGVVEVSYTVEDSEGLTSNEGIISLNISAKVYSLELTFTQEDDGKAKGADIIWVIDNSGSMADEQDELAVNFPSFAENFVQDGSSDFPFKMGITTTDAYASGRDVLSTDSSGNIYDLSSTRAEDDYEGFLDDFSSAVTVGVGGLGVEKSIQSANAIMSNSEYSSWFSGDDYLLIFIFVSDEKEQSTSKSITEWSSYLKNLKTNSDYVKTFSIVDPDKDTDDRYASLADNFSTSIYNINESFDSILDEISASISELISSFSLDENHNVDTDTLVVTVDDVEQELNTDYSFSNNKILFINVPEEGSEIKIGYSYTWN